MPFGIVGQVGPRNDVLEDLAALGKGQISGEGGIGLRNVTYTENAVSSLQQQVN